MNIFHKLGGANPRAVGQLSMSYLSEAQKATDPGVQVLASVLVALEMLRCAGLDWATANEYLANLRFSEEHRGQHPEFRTVVDYVNHEIKPKFR